MQKIKLTLLGLAMMLGLTFVPAIASVEGATVSAQKEQICKGINNGGTCTTTGTNNLGGWVKSVINVILYIIGAIAVLMIVIGGLRYVISGGDSSQTKSAKDTILYAVIGLVIAVMAYAIVNFVVANLNVS